MLNNFVPAFPIVIPGVGPSSSVPIAEPGVVPPTRTPNPIPASLLALASGDIPIPPIPPSGIVPGPQFTVLRSVTPETPSTAAWVDSGYVDFVSDCGADPTGVADIASALDRAYTYLQELALTVCPLESRLFIPAGFYLLKSNPVNTTWSFNGISTRIIIEGTGDGSVIAFNGGTIHFPNISVGSITIRDLAFYGNLNGTQPLQADCDYVFSLNIQNLGVLERLSFVNIAATDQVIDIVAGQWAARDILIGNCGAMTGGTACFSVRAVYQFEADNCRLHDVAELNGLAITGKASQQNVCYLTYASDGQSCRFFRMTNCEIDELCLTGIKILGEPGFLVSRCELTNINVEPTTLGSPSDPILIAQNIRTLDINGYYVGDEASGGFDSNDTSLIASLSAVSDIRMKNVFVVPTASANTIEADDLCGSFSLEEFSPNIVLDSSALQNVQRPPGWSEPNAYQVILPAGSVA
jgi:hypothetical protein